MALEHIEQVNPLAKTSADLICAVAVFKENTTANKNANLIFIIIYLNHYL
jgi:hypothetical protein